MTTFCLRRIGGSMAAVAIASVVAVSAKPAEALVLKLSSGASTATIVDGGAGDLAVAEAGVIVFFGAVGAFNIDITTGSSKPQIGSATNPQLGLVSFNANSSGLATLKIELTDTDFTAPVPTATFESSVNGALVPGTVSLSTYLDVSNVAFGIATGLATIGPVGPGNNVGGVETNTAATADPFSLTMVATISHASAATTQFDASITTVPIPGAVWLFGTGVLALLGIGYTRRRQAAA